MIILFPPSFPAWRFWVLPLMLIAVVVMVILWRLVKPFPWYVLAWPLHILMDIFTHRREFLPTPFLWPVSTWAFPGISWAEPWFMIVNYSIMLTVLVVILVSRRRLAVSK